MTTTESQGERKASMNTRHAALGPREVSGAPETTHRGYAPTRRLSSCAVLRRWRGRGQATRQRVQPAGLAWFRISVVSLVIVGAAGDSFAACSTSWTASGSSTLYNTCPQIGIGTSSPNVQLSLGSALNNTKLAIYDAGATSTYGFGVQAGQFIFHPNVSSDRYSFFDSAALTNELLTIKGTGNVGLGNTTPGSEVAGANYSRVLDVGSAAQVAAQNAVNILGYSTTADGMVADLSFSNNAIGTSDSRLGVFRFTRKSTNDSGQFDLYTRSAGSFIRALTIDPSGNVGIGTAAPTSRLHVVGDIYATGNVAAKYQDVAEWVPVLRYIEAATVVVLNPGHPNEVAASVGPYDTRVAGVVSEKPGVILGEAGEGKAMIATTGRVHVKVDASRVPVHVGDLLVTSDREGFAMRSEPLNVGGVPIHRPGTLIGKALEPLESGQGEILVLLSLQ